MKCVLRNEEELLDIEVGELRSIHADLQMQLRIAKDERRKAQKREECLWELLDMKVQYNIELMCEVETLVEQWETIKSGNEPKVKEDKVREKDKEKEGEKEKRRAPRSKDLRVVKHSHSDREQDRERAKERNRDKLRERGDRGRARGKVLDKERERELER